MRFSDGAERLAGLAGAVLGWRPDEFWRATPAELMTVVRVIVGEGEEGLARSDFHRLVALFPDASDTRLA